MYYVVIAGMYYVVKKCVFKFLTYLNQVMKFVLQDYEHYQYRYCYPREL